MVSILQLVQNLMHGDEDEEPQSTRYENGCAYFHEEEREGLAKICRLAIHSRYEDFVVDGFNVLHNKKPVIYLSAAARPGLGQYLCNQLGLPFPCLCRVPCNTMFGSQHQMDVAFLEKLIKDDIERGRLPLLLVANAGTAAVGHTDKIGRLKELCEQYGIWLHVEGQENLMVLTNHQLVWNIFVRPHPGLKAAPVPSTPSAVGRERHSCDALNRWLGEELKQLVPASGLTVMDLEVEGTCLRFSPLMTAAGTRGEDVDQLVACIQSKLPVLTCTCQLREEFKQEVMATAGLLYVDDPNWPGIGVVRLKSCYLMLFIGPEYRSVKSCVYIGMASDDIDVSELVETIAVTAREIEENSRLLENMTEVVRKGIQEAQVQLQKANEERLLEEGVLRQIPVVGSVLNWFSPVQASQKGRTFNLTAGSLESTEHTYVYKAQGTGVTPPQTPSGTRTKQRLPGQKPFKRSLRGSDAVSETSSLSHIEDLEKAEHLPGGPDAPEADSPEQLAPAGAEQPAAAQSRAQRPDDDKPQVEEPESLR
ncbi:pyridoxal-dependent decarboxylase domain-containing protein 1-like protein [Camelus ferus]|nr:pyridoxal-dependent decarboxylase domain-containing protein 1-like protein [Camelus ferus]